MYPAVARSSTEMRLSGRDVLLSCSTQVLDKGSVLRVPLPNAGLFDSMQAQQQQQQPITLKELASKDKPAVQISAAAGTIASAQESLARAPHDMDQEKRDASSPASAQQHLSSAPDSSAQPDSTKAQQASRQPSSEVITVQIAVTAPKADTDALSCSSGPDSLDGLQPLKPLTPAQSSEHSPGSSTQEQRAVIASSASMASSPAAGGLSCEVCNISTTSLELLQQHLQGRRHLKILAVQNPAADADARCESFVTCSTHFMASPVKSFHPQGQKCIPLSSAQQPHLLPGPC